MFNKLSPNKTFLFILEYLLYFILFFLSLKFFYLQTTIGSDITIHISIIDQFFNNTFYIPHPAFHIIIHWLSNLSGIPYAFIVPLFLSSLLILILIISKRILIYLLPESQLTPYLFLIALFTSIVTAIYVPWFNPYIYLGQWGPNIWHSPTMILLKPIALFSFFGMTIFILKDNYSKLGLGIFLSLLLLASTYTKPSFIICFIPALGIFLLFFYLKNIKLLIKIFLIFLPSVLLLIYQYIETYNLQNSNSYFHDNIIFTNFGVMKMYTKNVLFSTLLTIAFPLSILIIIRKTILNNKYLVLSWILVIISYLQAAFLAEELKFDQGAFIFGYVISLFILFFFSTVEYVSWFGINKTNKILIREKIFVGLLALLHLISGIIYFRMLILGERCL